MAYSRMSQAEKEEAYQRAKAGRAEQIAAAGSTFGAIADDGVPKIALADVPKGGASGRPSLIRILGRPALQRKDPTNAKEIFVSDISYLDKVTSLDDLPTDLSTAKRRTLRCIWPAQDPDRPSLLWRLHDKVMEYRWDPNIKPKGARVYFHAEEHAALFNEVAACGKPAARVINAWFPRRSYLLNVIDREQEAWHKENKSTLLLCAKRNSWVPKGKTEEQVRWTLGIGTTAYNQQIWDQVVDTYGYWDDYDILLWKLSDTPWYMAKHFSVEPEKTVKLGMNLTPATLKRAAAPITDEEASYDLIDFDASYPITSFRQIHAKLGYVFMMCDRDLGTHFYDELRTLADEESPDQDITEDAEDESSSGTSIPGVEKEWTPPAAKAAPAQPKATAPIASAPAQSPAAPKVDEPEARAPAKTARRSDDEEPEAAPSIPWDKLVDGTYNGVQYLGVAKLTDEEKSMILGVNEDGSFEYVKEWPIGSGQKCKTMKNTANQFYSPAAFHCCPKSGQEWED